jgi:hypothetical protein
VGEDDILTYIYVLNSREQTVYGMLIYSPLLKCSNISPQKYCSELTQEVDSSISGISEQPEIFFFSAEVTPLLSELVARGYQDILPL